ncbi:MAG: PAS domain S-box protein [Methanobacterium sp.]|nr:PAS domain S-box protein [Methanobacterium sp.]
MEEESKDNFISLLEDLIERIRQDDDYVSFMVGNMAAIVQYSEDAIIGTDNDGTILSWNKGAEKMYGYDTEEIMGKNISILVPRDRTNEIKCIQGKISEDKLINNFETIRQKKNGDLLDVSITVSPIKTSEDKIYGISTIERDITQQKMAEKALKKSEEKYHRLFNDDLTGDFIAKLDGKIIQCNPSFAEIYGFESIKDAEESNISNFNPKDWAEIISRLRTEKKIKGHQTTHQRPDGREIKIIANLIAISDESGHFKEIKGYIFEND